MADTTCLRNQNVEKSGLGTEAAFRDPLVALGPLRQGNHGL
jgi:hypothetical protein